MLSLIWIEPPLWKVSLKSAPFMVNVPGVAPSIVSDKTLLMAFPKKSAVVLVNSYSSIPLTPADIPGIDFALKHYLLHFAEFFVLSFLLLRAFVKYKIRNPFYFAILFTILYGSVDELHQFLVPGRIMSFLDVIADSVGGLFILFVKVLRNIKI